MWKCGSFQVILCLSIVVVTLARHGQHSHQSHCQQISWSPPQFYDSSNYPATDPRSKLDQPFFGFPSKEACQAALCVPKCGGSLPPKDLKLICQFVNATDQQNSSTSGVGQNTTNGTSKQNSTDGTSLESEVFAELRSVLDSLGPDAQIIRDENGYIIGVQEASDDSQVVVSNRGRNDDASVCCSTTEAYYFNRTLVDYFGANQTLAQIDEIGTYQLIRHGFCGRKGACHGQCDLIYVAMPLVIVPFLGEPIRYGLFNIPTYCTCRVSALQG